MQLVPSFVVIIGGNFRSREGHGRACNGGKPCSFPWAEQEGRAPLVLLPLIGTPSWAVIETGVGPSARATARKYTVAGGPSTPCQ